MAALGVGAELRLVDADEGDVALHRQCLHRPEQIARARRHDPFLAGDQRDLGRSLDRDDAVIDLACEQAERKTHHAAGMGGQALDRSEEKTSELPSLKRISYAVFCLNK